MRATRIWHPCSTVMPSTPNAALRGTTMRAGPYPPRGKYLAGATPTTSAEKKPKNKGPSGPLNDIARRPSAPRSGLSHRVFRSGDCHDRVDYRSSPEAQIGGKLWTSCCHRSPNSGSAMPSTGTICETTSFARNSELGV